MSMVTCIDNCRRDMIAARPTEASPVDTTRRHRSNVEAKTTSSSTPSSMTESNDDDDVIYADLDYDVEDAASGGLAELIPRLVTRRPVSGHVIRRTDGRSVPALNSSMIDRSTGVANAGVSLHSPQPVITTSSAAILAFTAVVYQRHMMPVTSSTTDIEKLRKETSSGGAYAFTNGPFVFSLICLTSCTLRCL